MGWESGMRWTDATKHTHGDFALLFTDSEKFTLGDKTFKGAAGVLRSHNFWSPAGSKHEPQSRSNLAAGGNSRRAGTEAARAAWGEQYLRRPGCSERWASRKNSTHGESLEYVAP